MKTTFSSQQQCWISAKTVFLHVWTENSTSFINNVFI